MMIGDMDTVSEKVVQWYPRTLSGQCSADRYQDRRIWICVVCEDNRTQLTVLAGANLLRQLQDRVDFSIIDDLSV